MDTGEQEQFDELKAAVAQIDKNIANLRDLEAIEKAEAADAATAKAVSGDEQGSVALPRSRHSCGKLVSVVRGGTQVNWTPPSWTRAQPASRSGPRRKALAFTWPAGTRNEVEIAQNMYPGDDRLVKSIQKAAVPAAKHSAQSRAGNLINEGGAAFADFVEYLRERSVWSMRADSS